MTPGARGTTVTIAELRRARPRNRFVRLSLFAIAGAMLGSLLLGGFDFGDALSARRFANLGRFAREVVPYPLQAEGWDTAVALDWLGTLLRDKGWAAAGTTLAISVSAAVLAAGAGLLLALGTARNLATAEPFLAGGRPPSRGLRLAWRGATGAARAVAVLLRAMPEYMLAFLLVAIIGPSAWPAVLALAIHNAGILGRLYGETIENVPPRVPAALRGLGASRPQLAWLGLWPLTLPRLLLYFFYRWESCVREATVLGMLGIVSLGYWILDARSRGRYDDFVALVLVGAALVLAGDLVSAIARRAARRS